MIRVSIYEVYRKYKHACQPSLPLHARTIIAATRLLFVAYGYMYDILQKDRANQRKTVHHDTTCDTAIECLFCPSQNQHHLLYSVHLPLQIRLALGPLELIFPLFAKKLRHDLHVLLALVMVADALVGKKK